MDTKDTLNSWSKTRVKHYQTEVAYQVREIKRIISDLKAPASMAAEFDGLQEAIEELEKFISIEELS